MSDTLKIKNSFVLNNDQWHQGATTDDIEDYFSITISGYIHKRKITLATGVPKIVFDASVDTPAAPVYWFYWCSADSFIQFTNGTNNLQVPVLAKAPFVLSGNAILPTTGTTIMGGSAPSTIAVAKVYAGQYSGSAADAVFIGLQ